MKLDWIGRSHTRVDGAAIVRWATASDSLSRHHAHLLAEAYGDGELYHAESRGEIVALGFVTPSGREIQLMEVAPASRGRGIGRAFAEALMNECRLRGATTVRVQCAPRESAPFWRAMGFSETGESVPDEKDGKLWMGRRLPGAALDPNSPGPGNG